jgi:hypothetical protein
MSLELITRFTYNLAKTVTLVELQSMIATTQWFTRCGQFVAQPGAVSREAVESSDDWDWLPTSRDQMDPIHQNTLSEVAAAMGIDAQRREAELAAARTCMASMRTVPDSVPVFVHGPHDSTNAAKGGAEFASRMAAREVVVGREDFWCRTLHLYYAGYWPCGFFADNLQLVVM